MLYFHFWKTIFISILIYPKYIKSSIFQSSLLHIWVYEENLSPEKRNGKTCMTKINLDGHQSFSCRMWLSSSSLPQLLKMVWRIIILVFYGCAKTSISGWEIVLTQSQSVWASWSRPCTMMHVSGKL